MNAVGVGTPTDGADAVLTRTTTQILESLRDPENQDLWQVFDDRYRPVLIAFARKQGLSEEDAADAAQITLAQFASDYHAGRYDRTRGRLSSWIIGIAQNRIADACRHRQRQGSPRGESALINVSDERTTASDWDDAVQKVVLERALHVLHHQTRLEERTLRAFDLAAMRGMPAEAVASECGMSVSEVYVAKNRVIKKLREIVAELTQEFDEV